MHVNIFFGKVKFVKLPYADFKLDLIEIDTTEDLERASEKIRDW